MSIVLVPPQFLARTMEEMEQAETGHAARGRSRLNGEGRKVKQNKNNSSPFSFQLQVIDYYSECKSMKLTMDKFFPKLNPAFVSNQRRTVYRWVNRRRHIELMCAKQKTAEQKRSRKAGAATTLTVGEEASVAAWINGLRKHGIPVSSAMVRMRGLEEGAKRGLTEREFGATSRWVSGFLNRHNLSIRRGGGQGQGAGDQGQFGQCGRGR